MPFTPDNAKVNHYPGTSKGACDEGYERCDMPADDGSNNMGRLNGRCFDTEESDTVKDSD